MNSFAFTVALVVGLPALAAGLMFLLARLEAPLPHRPPDTGRQDRNTA